MNRRDLQQDDTIIDSGNVSFLDSAFIIVKRRWFIIGTTVSAMVLIIIFSLFTILLPNDSPINPLPNYYKAQITFMIQDNNTISSKMSAAQEQISSLLGGSGGATSTNFELAKTLIKGNTLKDLVIQDLEFLKRYKIPNTFHAQNDARNILDKRLKLEKGSISLGVTASKNEIILINYTDLDPVFAKKVIDRVIEILSTRFKNLTQFQIRTKREFIEGRLAEVEKNLKDAKSGVAAFQVKYGIIDIPTQTKEQTNLLGTLYSDVIKSELELQNYKEYLSKDDPRIIRLQKDVDQKNKLINELKTGFKDYSNDFFIPQKNVPDLTNKYLDLYAEAQIQAKVYDLLRQEFEMAKIEEADTTQSIQIIEPSEVPIIKAGPSRPLLCIIVTFAAFFLSLFLAFVNQYMENIKKDPVEEKKYQAIKSVLSRN